MSSSPNLPLDLTAAELEALAMFTAGKRGVSLERARELVAEELARQSRATVPTD
jgi:hypothetical protein